MALTNFYIDGFNLYYRALKNTRYKWLDLFKLCSSLTPGHQVGQVRYFTAKIQGRPGDLPAPQRQATCIRALQTFPNISVHYGVFRTRRKQAAPTVAIPGISGTIEVWNTEEKGTDVNLTS